MLDFRAEQAKNRRRAAALLTAMFLLVVALCWAVGVLYQPEMTVFIVPLAVIIAVAGTWTSYWYSDRIVLRLTGARVIDHDAAPQLYNIVTEVCLAAGLSTPKIAIVDDTAPNAFATGRDPDHAVVAFTTGLLEVMDREQIQGVAAHELAHVANRDTLVSAVAATTAGVIAIISDLAGRMLFFGGGRSRNNNNGGGGWLLLIVAVVTILLAPVAAMLLRAAISRKREALADATAVAFTRNPAGLRRALETLAENSTVVRMRSDAVAHLWIESPLSGPMSKIFSTHPPMASRIDNLRRMESLPQYRQPHA